MKNVMKLVLAIAAASYVLMACWGGGEQNQNQINNQSLSTSSANASQTTNQETGLTGTSANPRTEQTSSNSNTNLTSSSEQTQKMFATESDMVPVEDFVSPVSANTSSKWGT